MVKRTRPKLFNLRVTDGDVARMKRLASYRRVSVSEMIRALLDAEEGRQMMNRATQGRGALNVTR